MIHILYLLLLTLAAFTSFEDFFLKFLPVPDSIFFYSRFVSEFSIYIAFILVLFGKFIKGIPLSKTPLDLPIIFFLCSALFSMLVNHSPLFGTIVNLRPWLRFFILFYLIVNIKITLNQASAINRTIICAGIVQVVLGILQYLSRGALDSFLLPRATDTEIGGVARSSLLLKGGREIGSIYGAAGDTVVYGAFMLLILILIISKLHSIRLSKILNISESNINYSTRNKFLSPRFLGILMPFLFITISLSYVRACVLAAIVLITIYSVRVFGKVRTMVVLSVAIVLASIIFLASPPEYSGNARYEEQSILANLTGIFTPDYTKQLKNQRLGALMGTAPTVIFNKPFLGYGADQISAIDRLNASKISFLTKVWTTEGFKDVYWVAILVFYGLSGLISMVWMFWRLYYCSRMIYKICNEQITKEIALSVNYIIIVTSFLLFFNRTIEFRIYGFYFWFLSGLMFSLYLQEKSQKLKSVREE